MEKPNGQICNVFGSRNNKDRRTRIRSFSVFGPNTPILSPSRRVYEPEASTPTLLIYTHTDPLGEGCVHMFHSHIGQKQSRIDLRVFTKSGPLGLRKNE